MSQSAEVLVSSRMNGGVRVYSPSNAKTAQFVSGNSSHPVCTCEDYRSGEICNHTRAAAHLLPPPEQTEKGGHGSQMLIKRSISPDGRIDSLSIEFTCDIGSALIGEIRAKAEKTLALQTSIIQTFLSTASKQKEQKLSDYSYVANNGNGAVNGSRHNQNGNRNGRHHERNGAVPPGDESPARLLSIGGMQTRFGWKSFISVETQAGVVKFFGSKKQLAEAIASAGFPDAARNVSDGAQLNLPCRVVLRTDGQYPKVEKVLPGLSNGSRY